MLKRIIMMSGISLCLATAALAQAPNGGIGGNSAAPSIAPDAGISQRNTSGSSPGNSLGTDPGITNSTRSSNGGVDLYKGGNTINPGGVNPGLQSSPTCGASRSDATDASGDAFCPQ